VAASLGLVVTPAQVGFGTTSVACPAAAVPALAASCTAYGQGVAEEFTKAVKASGGAIADALRREIVASDDGVAAGEPTECFNPTAVVMRAEVLSRKEGHVGAVAFSRMGDPATDDFSDAKVIRKFGDVPDDLNAL